MANKNKPKKPKVPTLPATGLYEGEAGANAARENPLGFFNHILGQSGRTFTNTAPDYWDFLQNQGFGGFTSGYDQAQGVNQLITMPKFVTAGGMIDPYAANRFAAVTPAATTPAVAQAKRRRRRR